MRFEEIYDGWTERRPAQEEVQVGDTFMRLLRTRGLAGANRCFVTSKKLHRCGVPATRASISLFLSTML